MHACKPKCIPDILAALSKDLKVLNTNPYFNNVFKTPSSKYNDVCLLHGMKSKNISFIPPGNKKFLLIKVS